MTPLEQVPDPDRPVPVVVLADEHEAYRQAEKKRKHDQRLGAAVVGVAAAPALGLAARVVFEWAKLGWQLL